MPTNHRSVPVENQAFSRLTLATCPLAIRNGIVSSTVIEARGPNWPRKRWAAWDREYREIAIAALEQANERLRGLVGEEVLAED